ncbi:DUF1788 domain-containing protein [Paratractidigestivibacter sp.]|uniref:DUF1788 domain-containing protein n=2 Tax=Paratractidigestivibacter sp. TaxID=2847316 RepID=UPI002ABDA4F0|nr:DUF1788 domain-containing protein [Paratractidigestivibacter sp.]
MTSQPANQTLAESFERIRSRFRDPEFLNCRGLGNEVPFFIYTYDAARELEVRELTDALVRDSEAGKLPSCVHHRDLWDVLMQICEEEDILDDAYELERDEGPDELLEAIQEVATPKAFVETMDFSPHERGRDVLLITGVGKVYPFVRAHDVMEAAQPIIEDIPVVLMYPGVFDGRTLKLFGRLEDGNYYRAFSLL